MSNDASLLAAVERSPSLMFLADMWCSWLTPIIPVWPQWSARHLWNAVAGGCVPVLVGAYQVYMYVRRRVCVHAYVCSLWLCAGACRCLSGCGGARARALACAYVDVHACLYACMHACVHVCMFVYIHACLHACIGVCVHVCVGVCMHVCTQVCVWVRVCCVSVCLYVHTHTHT